MSRQVGFAGISANQDLGSYKKIPSQTRITAYAAAEAENLATVTAQLGPTQLCNTYVAQEQAAGFGPLATNLPLFDARNVGISPEDLTLTFVFGGTTLDFLVYLDP